MGNRSVISSHCSNAKSMQKHIVSGRAERMADCIVNPFFKILETAYAKGMAMASCLFKTAITINIIPNIKSKSELFFKFFTKKKIANIVVVVKGTSVINEYDNA